jgi:DNA-binding response OmpR family regulator
MPNILVTDDDPSTRQMVRRILKKKGYSVGTAADGIAALRLIRSKKVDLVLLDIWMPKMTGLGLLGSLQGESDIPKIIVMMPEETTPTLMNSMRGRVYQFLRKPFDADTLLATVENALSHNPAEPAIEVLSERSVVNRVQSFLSRLESDIPEDVLEKVGYAFRELLNNAIEWGGHLDPNLKVRISYIRTRKMLMYRLDDPGPGFKLEDLKHAAISNPEDNPMAHIPVREEKGLRPGGLGLLLSHQLVDGLVYNETRNQVVLIKYL